MDSVEKPPVVESPVSNAIDSIAAKIDILGDLVRQFSKQLTPVMSPQCKTEASKPARAPATCPVEESLLVIIERLEKCIDGLRDIESRIKV